MVGCFSKNPLADIGIYERTGVMKMDEAIMIKLLQIHFEHQRKLHELAGKINLSYFELDLLSLVLDAAGIPADNTIKQIRKYGYQDWIEQPDTFSRAWYYEKFQQQVAHGTYEECWAFWKTSSSRDHFTLRILS